MHGIRLVGAIPHIRTLYHPWQPGNGYEEATLEAVETELGIHLPMILLETIPERGLVRLKILTPAFEWSPVSPCRKAR